MGDPWDEGALGADDEWDAEESVDEGLEAEPELELEELQELEGDEPDEESDA